MSDAPLDPSLRATLERATACLNAAGVLWTLIGGAAMELHRRSGARVKDIDIVVTHSAAALLGDRFSWRNHAEEGSDRFRSTHLFQPDFGPVPVEIMGGFEIHAASGWTPVLPGATQTETIGSRLVHVPSKERLAEIFRLCGRDKDILRANLLLED